MAESPQRRTLIVANLTAATPILLQEVERHADEQPTRFTLLIPNVESRQAADWTLENAVKLLEKAAGGPVEGRAATGDPFTSVRDELAGGDYDHVIVSTLPRRASEWLRRDLPARIRQLGVPVTVITPPEEPSPLKAFADSFSAKAPTAGR